MNLLNYLKSENQNLIETIKLTQEEVGILKKTKEKNDKNKDILRELFNKGVINGRGQFLGEQNAKRYSVLNEYLFVHTNIFKTLTILQIK